MAGSASKSSKDLIDLVIISGFSGAGKSSAMEVFEEARYFCVDNLPPDMIKTLFELLSHSGSKVEQAAVVCDPRGGPYFERLIEILGRLRDEQIRYQLIFLEADESTLVSRYKQTRRRHPIAPVGTIVEGIRREAQLLASVRDHADLIVDTTELNNAELRKKLSVALPDRSSEATLAVSFLSFGHKKGAPRDADLVLDVRFLNNPYYVTELTGLTGFDQRVVDYIADDKRLSEFYERLFALLDFLLPQYIAEGKAHLVVAIGCTGGRHRSVVISEHLAERYRTNSDYAVSVQHRDLVT